MNFLLMGLTFSADMCLILYLLGYRYFFNKRILACSYVLFAAALLFDWWVLHSPVFFYLSVLIGITIIVWIASRSLYHAVIFIVLTYAIAGLAWLIVFELPAAIFMYSKYDITLTSVIFLCCLNLLFCWLICYLLYKLDNRFYVFECLLNNSLNRLMAALFLLISFILYLTLTYDNFPHRSTFETLLTSVTFYFYITSTLTAIYFFTLNNYNRKRLNLLEQTFHQEKQHYEYAEQIQHDFNGLLLSTSYYIEKGENQKALDLLSQIGAYTNNPIKKEWFQQILNLKIPPLQGLFIQKIKAMQQEGIQSIIKIPQEIDEIDMHMIDLIRCLSILLNNASEAARQNPAPYVKITIKNEETTISIQIKNNFKAQSQLELPTILQKHFTTKDSHKGLGLSNFATLVNKYPNIYHSFVVEEETFIANLKISK